METAVLILAAGSSSRMGESKQLLLIEGKPMLVRAIETAIQASQNITVVLGSLASEHRRVLAAYPVTVFENVEWKMGIGRSLKSGLDFVLQQTPGVDSVIIMVCDQPRLTTSHLVQLIAKAKGHDVTLVASRYKKTLGVPALFKKALFSALLTIADDSGASRLIREQSHVESVDFPGGETDLDTFDEYLRFSNERQ